MTNAPQPNQLRELPGSARSGQGSESAAQRPRRRSNRRAPAAAETAAADVPTGPRRLRNPNEIRSQLVEFVAEHQLRRGNFHGTTSTFIQTMDGRERRWLAMQSQEAVDYVRSRSFQLLGEGPPIQAVTDALERVEARVVRDTPVPVRQRVARVKDKIYLYLGPGQSQVVEVTVDGWKLVEDSPVLFRSNNTTADLPIPEPGGTLRDLRELLPSVADEDWPSLAGVLVAYLNPDGPFPILVVRGQQGSGKSMASELIASLVDPTIANGGRTFQPPDSEQLVTIAHNRHIVSFDNISAISPELSDALCMVSTGGAFEARTLYRQGQVTTLNVLNPVILNGIALSALRADLTSRSVILDLREIPEARRRTEIQIRREFQERRARILGVLLDATVMALREADRTRIEPTHRLTDAAQFATAAEPALGFPDGAIVRAWIASQERLVGETVGTDQVAESLREFLNGKPSWEGATTTLSRLLDAAFQGNNRPLPAVIATPEKLGRYLSRNAALLRAMGIGAAQTRTSEVRCWRLEHLQVPPSQVGLIRVTRHPSATPAAAPVAIPAAAPVAGPVQATPSKSEEGSAQAA